jgi:hypothetical protein
MSRWHIPLRRNDFAWLLFWNDYSRNFEQYGSQNLMVIAKQSQRNNSLIEQIEIHYA